MASYAGGLGDCPHQSNKSTENRKPYYKAVDTNQRNIGNLRLKLKITKSAIEIACWYWIVNDPIRVVVNVKMYNHIA